MIQQLSQTNDVVLESGQTFKDVIRELRSAGYFAVLVDRAPVFDKETLLHALYQSCVFPASFGFNWDALEDTLLDFSWLDQEVTGYVLVFRNFALLENRDETIAHTFLDIARDVANVRKERNCPPLFVVKTL